nr:hypothetical protein [Helicobacter rodentium]
MCVSKILKPRFCKVCFATLCKVWLSLPPEFPKALPPFKSRIVAILAP